MDVRPGDSHTAGHHHGGRRRLSGDGEAVAGWRGVWLEKLDGAPGAQRPQGPNTKAGEC